MEKCVCTISPLSWIFVIHFFFFFFYFYLLIIYTFSMHLFWNMLSTYPLYYTTLFWASEYSKYSFPSRCGSFHYLFSYIFVVFNTKHKKIGKMILIHKYITINLVNTLNNKMQHKNRLILHWNIFNIKFTIIKVLRDSEFSGLLSICFKMN